MATLKISDLSVGDWVALEGADLKIEHGDIATAFVEEVRKPICIQSILGEDKLIFATTYHLDGYGTIYAKEELLRPIPITPEILEANGFEKIRENVYFDSYCWTNKKDTMIEMSHYKETYNVKIVQLVDGLQKDRFCNLDILFVHQLQHILRLAGVEKEIIMPKK